MNVAGAIERGETVLGIELGSTRIKAVLIDENNSPVASGSYLWENRFENALWTYSEEEMLCGLRGAYLDLKRNVQSEYNVTLKRMGAIGISAMMHGYLVFDKNAKMLVPFRTWRNNNAEEAAERLTQLFGYHIPARWSVAHLYQAILDGEPHVRDISFQMTLAGYIHYLLTGEKAVGVGEASGMFPIDSATKYYDGAMLEKFDKILKDSGLDYRYEEILPSVLLAGERAGYLSKRGAALLDPEGDLISGIPFCPPEGDAGTGMVATNSVKVGTGNVSAGTSVFAMIVLEKGLSASHEEIDLVATPTGELVGMVHCNNCTSDLNDWVKLFGEMASLAGLSLSAGELYDLLYLASERGDKDCGGLISYNCVSGENITHVDEGRPLFVRTPESKFNLANFMRSHLYSAFAALKIGCDVLLKEEGVRLTRITGHGGIFKTERVAQSYLAAALGVPVTVEETAGEGGAWGMAVLAGYYLRGNGEALEDYLEKRVFVGAKSVTVRPDPKTVKGFSQFIKRYKKCLPVVRQAVKKMR